MTRLYDPNNVLLMDGTASITDLITSTAFTMAGTAVTATLLGATAPAISATEYTSCSIATPFTAGQPLTILCAVNTTWAGNDAGQYYFFSNGIAAAVTNSVIIRKAGTLLLVQVRSSNLKYKAIAVDAVKWPASTPHIIIATLAADNTQQIFLDGVEGTTTSGTSAREGAEGDSCMIGGGVSVYPCNGLILCALWTRVLENDEITALSTISAWSLLTDETSSPTPPVVKRKRTRAIFTGGNL